MRSVRVRSRRGGWVSLVAALAAVGVDVCVLGCTALGVCYFMCLRATRAV
jgi:aspartate/glutamate racemase